MRVSLLQKYLALQMRQVPRLCERGSGLGRRSACSLAACLAPAPSTLQTDSSAPRSGFVLVHLPSCYFRATAASAPPAATATLLYARRLRDPGHRAQDRGPASSPDFLVAFRSRSEQRHHTRRSVMGRVDTGGSPRLIGCCPYLAVSCLAHGVVEKGQGRDGPPGSPSPNSPPRNAYQTVEQSGFFD